MRWCVLSCSFSLSPLSLSAAVVCKPKGAGGLRFAIRTYDEASPHTAPRSTAIPWLSPLLARFRPVSIPVPPEVLSRIHCPGAPVLLPLRDSMDNLQPSIASDGAVAVDADDPAADPAAAAAGGVARSSSLRLTHTPRAVSYCGGGSGGGGLVAQPSSSVVVTYHMCTLNVGGRNTNSFEFMMRGDHGPLAQRWEVLYGRAERTMCEKGPADVPSLAANLDAIAESVGGHGQGSGVAERLLAYPTWAAMMGALQSERSMLLNALNLTTLRQGRPSPLEMPEVPRDGSVARQEWAASPLHHSEVTLGMI